MDSSELYDAFRSDVVDTARPYLWTDAEVYRYMNSAYRMFVRLTGGVADFTSAATAVDVLAGEANGVLHPSVLRITSAQRASDSASVKIINHTDIGKLTAGDYGRVTALTLDDTPGPVRYGVIGMQRGIIRWLQVPEADDVVNMTIYRTPLERISNGGQEFTDADEDHHDYFLDWMKHLAYKKQDADTLNLTKSEECRTAFEGYCVLVNAEWERYKHKNREVSYGGL